MEWKSIIDLGNKKPDSLSGHSICNLNEENYIMIFGGMFEDHKRKNEVWIYDTYKKKFFNPNNESNSSKKNKSNGNYFKRMFKTKKEQLPDARERQSLCLLDKQVILFGGISDHKKKLNDTWEFKKNAKDVYYWNKCKLNTTVLPTPRYNHSCCRINETTLIFFGGYNGEFIDEVWLLIHSPEKGKFFNLLTSFRLL